jgi:hypothetical protein
VVAVWAAACDMQKKIYFSRRGQHNRWHDF